MNAARENADVPAFDALLERIFGADPPDWSALDAEPSGGARLDALRTLAAVETVFRRCADAQSAPRERALFQWGPLAVLEEIAQTPGAQVYRAFDAGLGLDVALKLAKADTVRTSAFLAEARALAKVCHRHVLSVFGAAVHEGRAGIWSEWVEGRSLQAQVDEDGPLGPDETALAGLALCRALGAIHAAGLLHGDVKPANVLRERGGRLVLADLGAGGEPAAVNASLRSAATPAYVAPEVLDGAARTPAQDLYALGGLLLFLLEGRAPDAAHDAGTIARADVPPALRAVLAKARAADPAARYASAIEMERALADCLPAGGAPPPAPARRRFVAGVLAGAALAAALAVGLFQMRASPGPPEVQLELLRQRGDAVAPLADGGAVALGDALSFAVTSAEPVWLYVFGSDETGAVQRLFPLPRLDTANPLPPGRRIEIPGRWQGRAMRLTVSSEADAEHFLVAAARAPVARLESFGYDGAEPTRGVELAPATASIPATRLDALAAELAAAEPGLRWWRYRLPHRATY